MIDILLHNLSAVAAALTVVWLISIPLRDVSIVDIVWGLGFVLIAWVSHLTAGDDVGRSLLVAILVTIWGVRLAGYLAWRNLGHGEDFRYQAMRRKVGASFWIVSLFTVFWLQGLLMLVVSLPVQAAGTGNDALRWLDWLGVAFWAIGLFFETVGDAQLARFKADPSNEGRVMEAGLWRYTRHPNYFGDFMVWWGLWAIAVSAGAWWTIVGPVVMTALLMKYSGAGLLEKSIGKRRPGYDEYVARTNSFFPGPPKEGGIS